MPNTEIYDHLLLVIEAFKVDTRTESQTELFVENICNKIDKHYVNNELTHLQYEALYSVLPK